MTDLLTVSGLGISFGAVRAVNDVSFSAKPGEVLSIIGPNGAGKTTLFNMISGVYQPSQGRVTLDGADVTDLLPHQLAERGLSRTFQNLQIFHQMTALENVMAGRHLMERRGLLSDLFGLSTTRRHNRETRQAAEALLERVGLADVAHREAGGLSYGMLKRLEIARALACHPQLLLLDEPAAGCNPVETEEVEHLIARVAQEGVGILLVEHDMKMVMRVSSHIVVLDHGEKLVEGRPEVVREDPRVIAAYLGVAEGTEEVAHALH
jgi:branched-chain amino acid transport system ATP-binding protein